MKKRAQVTVGITIIVFGCLLLISNLLQINLWSNLSDHSRKRFSLCAIRRQPCIDGGG